MNDDTVAAEQPHVLLVRGEDRDIAALAQGYGGECGVGRIPVPVRPGGLQQADRLARDLLILLHGMSAPYFADRYGNWYDTATATTPDLREAQDAPAGAGNQHSGPRRLRRAGRDPPTRPVCARPGCDLRLKGIPTPADIRSGCPRSGSETHQEGIRHVHCI